MGLVRFVVVFLLGLGAAFGASATGALDYLSGASSGWFSGPRPPVVLHVSADGSAGNSTCQPRYSVDNHSSRRVLVFFTPADESTQSASVSEGATPRGYGGPPGYYGSKAPNGPYAPNGPETNEPPTHGPQANAPQTNGPETNAPAYAPQGSATNVPPAADVGIRAEAEVPVEIRPGEEKYLGPQITASDDGTDSPIGQYGADVRAAMATVRCANSRLVTLQLNDCSTDGSGVCSVASTFSPAGEYSSY